MEFINTLGTLDAAGIVVLLLGAALLGLLIGVGSGWRELQRGMRNAPVQYLAGGAGRTLSGRQLRDAEVRCALCPVKAACRAVLERGGELPPECPNRILFEKGVRNLFP